MTAPGDSRDRALPPELEDKLADAFWRSAAQREERFAVIVAENPEYAEAMQGFWRKLATDEIEHSATHGANGEREPWLRSGRIGGYRILQKIGEGGFGVVYLAEQETPKRKVALKILKHGVDHPSVLARFRHELDTLGAMHAPNIARIYDAGEDRETGHPFFALEHIPGSTTLTEFCAARGLSLSERVRLFQAVCRGVQHAHMRGVLHRDLKPANVLVSQDAGQAVPKIIDFGLARTVDRDLADAIALSRDGQFLGTPAYSSPEQARGDRDIDGRTDVYSLGVMLYELFVGERPFSNEALAEIRNQVDLVAFLDRSAVVLPSARVSESRDPRLRSTSAHLRGDLDWIVMKAIAKDRDQRYAGPGELADDLQRYLDSAPVLAGPPSIVYRLRKFVRRYRPQVIGAALVLLTFVAGMIGTTWFFYDARAQERVVAEFRGLEVATHVEQAIRAQAKLYPAWPENVPALEAWLEKAARPIEEGGAAKIEASRRLLAERELPSTEAERLAHRRQSIVYAAKERKLRALRRAMQVRKGQVQHRATRLPASLSLPPGDLMSLSWRLVRPGRADELYGDEGVALAAARIAVRQAARSLSLAIKLHKYHDTLAWALFANGLDDEAVAEGQAAIRAVPWFWRSVREVQEEALNVLRAAIAEAPKELAAVEQELASLGAELDRGHSRYASPRDELLSRELRRASESVEAFVGRSGALRSVRKRLRWARSIDSWTRAHPNASVAWSEALGAIRAANGRTASTGYAEHRSLFAKLEPQTGLVPIGMNPRTKLWEFYHLASASPAGGDDASTLSIPKMAADGRIAMTGAMGVVFVLLPGGKYWMGRQRTSKRQPNYEPRARPWEEVEEQRLAPFFMSRFELTQGQWQRLGHGSNPSRHRPPDFGSLAHPVERVSWRESVTLLRRHALDIPSEVQWEYACRAGRSTPWWTGPSEASLAGACNILDLRGVRSGGHASALGARFDDEHVVHAPVGSYRPNDFGLYDTHGNIAEFCRSSGLSRSRPLDRHLARGVEAVARGGCYASTAEKARVTYREAHLPTTRSELLGLRATRRLLGVGKGSALSGASNPGEAGEKSSESR